VAAATRVALSLAIACLEFRDPLAIDNCAWRVSDERSCEQISTYGCHMCPQTRCRPVFGLKTARVILSSRVNLRMQQLPVTGAPAGDREVPLVHHVNQIGPAGAAAAAAAPAETCACRSMLTWACVSCAPRVLELAEATNAVLRCCRRRAALAVRALPLRQRALPAASRPLPSREQAAAP